MPVRPRIVGRPTGVALGPRDIAEPSVAAAEAASVDAVGRGIHQAGEDPLGLFLPVGGHGEVRVLPAGEFAKRALEGINRAEEDQPGPQLPRNSPQRHARCLFVSIADLERDRRFPLRFRPPRPLRPILAAYLPSRARPSGLGRGAPALRLSPVDKHVARLPCVFLRWTNTWLPVICCTLHS